MRVDPSGGSDRERRLETVLASYYEGGEDGESPTREALIGPHPELAGELAEFFALQDDLHHVSEPIREVVGATGRSARACAGGC